MISIIFLGNIGTKYALNRHNIGFIYADQIINQDQSFSLKKSINGFVFETTAEYFSNYNISKNPNTIINNSQKIVLIKPNCYMNESGNIVSSVKSKYNPQKIIVLHDELDLQFGVIKHKFGGGDNGHNGLKSITQRIGPNYWRIRFGIGRPLNETSNNINKCISVSDHVLSNFTKDELKVITCKHEELVSHIVQIIST